MYNTTYSRPSQQFQNVVCRESQLSAEEEHMWYTENLPIDSPPNQPAVIDSGWRPLLELALDTPMILIQFVFVKVRNHFARRSASQTGIVDIRGNDERVVMNCMKAPEE
jgi:hypothetical protein